MKNRLKGDSLDWALLHLCRYCDSDLFPRMFEFNAIRQNWEEVKVHILAINLDKYVPQTPLIRFAPKLTGAQRIVHRLGPIDAIIYTAMVYEMHQTIEEYRTPATELNSCLRVETDAGGSFFSTARGGWQRHTARVESLARQYRNGFVLMADIMDFYGQIQPRRLGRILAEPPANNAEIARPLSRFLDALSPASGRGIPVGPAASTVLAEVVLADLDRKLVSYTADFARWGDDLRLFFATYEEAHSALRDLSDYLHATHEMIFGLEKTRVVPVEQFMTRYFRGLPEETVAAGPEEARLSEFVGQQNLVAHHYAWGTAEAPEPRPMAVYLQLQAMPEFQTAEKVYLAHFNKAVTSDPPDLLAAKRILRKAALFRIRNLIPDALANFDRLMLVIREAGTYLRAVLGEESSRQYAMQLRDIWDNNLQGSSYFHDWMCHVFTNPGLDDVDLPANYSTVVSIRNQALLALRRRDGDWIRRHAAHMKDLDSWDRHAVLYACSVLPPGERASVLGAALARGGIVERSIARYVEGLTGHGADRSIGKPAVKGPDNYPSYGDKPAAKSADIEPLTGRKPDGQDRADPAKRE
jgi:hypothetical protein